MKDSGSELILVGRILAPQGNKGEVRVESFTDNAARLTEPGQVIASGHAGTEQSRDDRVLTLTGGRPHGKFFAVKFDGVDSISAAEALRGLWLKVPRSSLPALPDGSFYLFEIIGLEAVSESGESFGIVEEIMRGPGNDVYVVRGARGELLLPATRAVILDVDRAHRRLVVRPPEPYERQAPVR